MVDPFLGEIRVFSFDYPPKGWAYCTGQLLPINQYQALFSLLGTAFGGDGRTNFALPDLQGRVATAPANAGGALGGKGGSENVTIDATTMPAHTHALMGTSAVANKRPAAGHLFAADSLASEDFYAPASSGGLIALAPGSMSLTGGGQPHPNIQPYLCMNFCIALQGIFPSRS